MLALLLFGMLAIPAPAYAYNFITPDTIGTATGRVCAIDDSILGDANLQAFGFTKRIVICVKETILSAVYNFLVPFSDYIAKTIAVAITLAVALWGVMMVSGRTTAPIRDAFVLAVKIGAVVLFTANFGGIFPVMLDAMESLLSIVTGFIGFSTFTCPNVFSGDSLVVWERVDCAINTLIGGIFSAFTVGSGIVGLLVALLFSGTIGLFIGLMGVMLIVQLLFAIARAVYIFVTGYIAFALMALMSPLFVPLILFRATKSFFEKWLKLTMGFVLQPVFIFVYLTMLMAAFDTIVYSGPRSLYRAIAGGDVNNVGVSVVDQFNFSMGDWLLASGAYAEKSQGSFGVNIDPKATVKRLGLPDKIDTGTLKVIGEHFTNPADWQGDIYAVMGKKNFAEVQVALTTSADLKRLADVNHEDVTDYTINLFLSFIMALVTTYIFMSMLDFLPFIGSGLTGDAFSVMPFGTGRLAPPGSEMIKGMKDKFAATFTGGR